MMKRLFIIPVIIIILLSTLILGSCGTSTSTTSTASSTIKVGLILDLTGADAMVGQLMQASLQLAFADNGNQINGHPVEIITGDAQGQAAAAVDVAKKMVENDKVVAIFGPNEIGEKFAVSSYIAQIGIPMILLSPTPLSIFQGNTANKWVVGVDGSTAMQPTCMADYLYKQLGYKTIDTITQDDSAGHSFLDPLMDAYKAIGGQVVQSLWTTFPCQDFNPYLTTLKKADAVVAWTSGSDSILFLTQYHQSGIDKKMPFVGAFHGAFLDSFIVNALPADIGASVVGAVTVLTYSPDSQDPVNQAFVKSFTAKMGFPPGDDTSAGPYQAATVFIAAVKATNGDTTPNTLLSAISKVNVTGPEGPASFSTGINCSNLNIYIVKVTQFAPGVFGYTTVSSYNNVPPTGYVSK